MLKCKNQSIEMNNMQVLYTQIWLSYCFEILPTAKAHWCISKVLTPIEGFSFCFCTFISIHQFFHLPIVGYKIRTIKNGKWTDLPQVYHMCSFVPRGLSHEINSHQNQLSCDPMVDKGKGWKQRGVSMMCGDCMPGPKSLAEWGSLSGIVTLGR